MSGVSGSSGCLGTVWRVQARWASLVVAAFFLTNVTASASPILDGWGVNIDGIFTSFNQVGPSTASSFPAEVNASQYDVGTLDPPNGSPGAGTGLGTLTLTIQGTGSQLAIVWLDLHIDNGGPVYWDEFGATQGTAGAGQTWQIDEPGNGSLGYTGTVYNNVRNSTLGTGSLLTNSNALPVNGPNSPNDTSLAIGQSFTLGLGQTAVWTISVGFTNDPGSLSPQFYLLQSSADVPGTIALSSSLAITTALTPEPTTWILAMSATLVFLTAKLRVRPNR